MTDTPGAIVATARKLFELKGVRATSIAAIAKEANVTRELIYYHFANRNGLIEAVIDDYVEDLVESVIVWNEARIFGDTPGSLRKCIRTFRYSLYDGAGRPRPMIGVLEELSVRDAFDVRATRETADCLANHIAKEYAAYHRVEIELVHEMFCVAIFGLVGLVKMNPRIEDDVLMSPMNATSNPVTKSRDANVMHPHPICPTSESSSLTKAAPIRTSATSVITNPMRPPYPRAITTRDYTCASPPLTRASWSA